jgi:MFS transporter, PPP family, 3-phenylpropionic acid transporter
LTNVAGGKGGVPAPAAESTEAHARESVAAPGDSAVRWIRAIALLLGIASGTLQPFVAIVLVERGLQVSTVGLVLALGSLAGMLLNPGWGYLADTRLGPMRMLQLLTLGGGAAILAMNLLLPEPLIGLLYIMGAGVGWAAWVPLTDSLTIRIVPSGSGYARVRLLQSFSFAIAALASGVVYQATGYGASLLVFPALTAVYCVVAGAGPASLESGPGRVGPRPSAALSRAAGDAAARSPVEEAGRPGGLLSLRLAAVLVVTALVMIGQSGANSFLGLLVVELGGSPAQVAAAASISAFAEIPAMLAAGWLAGRLGLRATFMLFASLFLATFLVWATVTDVTLLLASKLLSGLAYGGLLVSAVLAVRSLVPADRQSTGQAVFQATCFGLTAIVASAAGGAIHALIGFSGFFALCAALAAAALAMGWVYPSRASARAAAEAGELPLPPPAEIAEPT